MHWLTEYAFSVNEKEHTSISFFSSKVLISLDNTFSWLFLLVCFDTKPLFLKVKKSKSAVLRGIEISFYIPVVSKNQNSLVFTFEKIFWVFFTLLDFHSFRLTSKSKYFANQCKIKLTSEEMCILSVWIFIKRMFF